jgi:hypothetical protein
MMETVMTAGWTKSCLTCGKIMPAGASYCPRCGGAFLRASEGLFGGIAPAPGQPAAHARTSNPTLLALAKWLKENAPALVHARTSDLTLPARPLAWYAGRLVRRMWLLILAIW